MKLKQSQIVKNKFNKLKLLDITLYNKIIDSIFGVLYVLLKDDDESGIYLFIFLSITEFLEFLQFPFSQSLYKYWNNNPIAVQLANTISYINIVNYLNTSNEIVYLTIYYLFVLAVTLVILNILYVSYSFSRKYFTYTWPLYVLSKVAKIFVTVLFMPILELFLSLFVCKYDEIDGKYKNSTSTDVVCFEGFHILHMIISLIVSTIFLIICIIVAISFFECSEVSEEFEAKENSRSDIVMILSKLVSTVIFSFFNDEKYDWFLILVILILSSWQFFKHFTEKPNHNHILQVYLSTLNGIYFWTCILISFSYLFYDYGFKGTVYIWLFSSPIIVVLVIFSSDDKQKVLTCNYKQLQTGEEIQKYIRYFLKVVEDKGKSKQDSLLLSGFIYNHEESCEILTCPLKQYQILESQNNNYEDDGIKKKNNSLYDEYLLLFADRLFNLGLALYPNCTSLRIKYALFQWDRFKNKNLCLQHLYLSEKYNPPMDQKFIIYRYRKIITEEEESKSYKGEILDLVSGIAYESHFKQCMINIEKSTQLYMDFWEQLLNINSNFDINKLNEIGVKINNTFNNIEIHWKSMQALKQNDLKAIKLYSGYLIYVLNDKIRGNEISQQWKEKIDKNQSNVRQLNMNLDEKTLNLVKEGSGILICGYEINSKNRLNTMIRQATSSLYKIFGYLEKEIMGKEIEFLFLDIYKEVLKDYIIQTISKEKKKKKGKKSEGEGVNEGENENKEENIKKEEEESKKNLSIYNDKTHIKSRNINNLNGNIGNMNSKKYEFIFFGKTKYQKAIPICVKFFNYNSLSDNNKSFACLISLENSLIDVKLFIKNAYFIVNSSLKIVSEVNTSQTIEIMNTLNRKLESSVDSLTSLFPEILRKDIENEYYEDKKITSKKVINKRDSMINDELIYGKQLIKREGNKSITKKMVINDWKTKKSNRNLVIASERNDRGATNLEENDKRKRKFEVESKSDINEINNQLKKSISITILNLVYEPQSVFIQKIPMLNDESSYNKENKENNDDENQFLNLKINNNIKLGEDYYPGECVFFPLCALSNKKIFDQNSKDYIYDSFYCFNLKIQLKNLNLDNKIKLNMNKTKMLFFNLDKLAYTVNEDKGNKFQFYYSIKSIPGGISNFYSKFNGQYLKDIYIKLNNKNITDAIQINHLSKNNASSIEAPHLDSYFSEKKDSEKTVSNNENQEKKEVKIGIPSQNLLNIQLEKVSLEEFKRQIELVHDYTQHVKIMYVNIIENRFDEYNENELKSKQTIQTNQGNIQKYNTLNINNSNITQTIMPQIKEFLKEKIIYNTNDMSLNQKKSINEYKRNILSNTNSKYENKNGRKDRPSILKKLSLFSLLTITLFIVNIITDFHVKNSFLYEINLEFTILKNNLQLTKYFQVAGMLFKEISLINSDYNITYSLKNIGKTQSSIENTTNSVHSYEIINRNIKYLSKIESNLSNIITIYNELESDQYLINNLFSTKTLYLKSYENLSPYIKNSTYSYMHAFHIQSSYLILLVSSNKSNVYSHINNKNEKLKEYFYNIYNDFYITSSSISSEIVLIIEDKINKFIIVTLIILIISIVFYIVFSSVMTIIISKIEDQKSKILKSFYSIPLFYVKYLSELCSIFLLKLNRNQVIEDNDYDEGEVDITQMEIEEIESNFSSDIKKKRTAYVPYEKNVSFLSNSRRLFVRLIIFLLYFILSFIIFTIVLIDLKYNYQLLLVYSNTQINYILSYNLLRESIENPSFPLLVEEDNTKRLNKLFSLYSNMTLSSNEAVNFIMMNEDYIYEEYFTGICNILNKPLCPYISSDNTDISNICNGNMSIMTSNSIESVNLRKESDFGLTNMFQKYKIMMDSLYNEAYSICNSTTTTNSSMSFCIKNTSQLDINLLDNTKYKTTYDIVLFYLIPSFDMINDLLIRNILYKLGLLNVVNIGFLICFLIIFVLGYLTIWLPFEYKVNEDITRTKLMLNLFPDDLLDKSKFKGKN